jgi:hypothetical protein
VRVRCTSACREKIEMPRGAPRRGACLCPARGPPRGRPPYLLAPSRRDGESRAPGGSS